MSPQMTWHIARRELRALFDQPTGYILLVVFLAVTNFLYFRQLFLVQVATLRPMLEFLPWTFLFFVPAVTMRAVAEDARSGTLEVVLAQPVTELELVLGKYLGQLLFVWSALALTVPVAIGLSFGADLQVGVIVAQYVGAALLAAGLSAVGLWASSVTRNQITAFILAVAVMFPLILVGLNPLIVGLPPVLATVAANLGVLSHFQNIARGVIDLRDAVYFVTLAAIFLAFAHLAVMGKRLSPHRETRGRLRLGTALIAITLVVVNLFGRHIGGRLDLTPGNAYTLSPYTKELLRGLDDLVTFKLFVSPELPPTVSLVKRDIEDLFGDIESAGGSNVRVLSLDPTDDEDAASEARSLGIPPIQFNVIGQSELSVKEGYLGIAVQYADGAESIPFVERTDDLEYRLASFVRSLTRTERPVVGLVTQPEPGSGSSFQMLREELERTYEVRSLSAYDSAPALDGVATLVMVGNPGVVPSFPVAPYRAFLDGGGGLLVMASGMQRAPQGFMAQPAPVLWNRVLEPLGVTIRSDMVYDLASNERVQAPAQGGQFQLIVAYPFWMRAVSTRASTVNRDIDAVLLPWASTIDTSRAVPGTVTPLLTSSRAAGKEMAQVFVAPQRRDFPQDSLAVQLVAALVDAAANDSAEGPARAVIVGNADFVSDRFAQGSPSGVVFALNAVDWLAQESALISIRAKDRSPPTLVLESDVARDAIKYGNLIGVPLLLSLAGVLRLWRRKRRSRLIYRPRSVPEVA
jgi:ABC-type uncharacterized transport system involved in gliding motility auxiliary subunit/ABC-type transport system involved in multi-copper enzyme maturation permease subunit